MPPQLPYTVLVLKRRTLDKLDKDSPNWAISQAMKRTVFVRFFQVETGNYWLIIIKPVENAYTLSFNQQAHWTFLISNSSITLFLRQQKWIIRIHLLKYLLIKHSDQHKLHFLEYCPWLRLTLWYSQCFISEMPFNHVPAFAQPASFSCTLTKCPIRRSGLSLQNHFHYTSLLCRGHKCLDTLVEVGR